MDDFFATLGKMADIYKPLNHTPRNLIPSQLETIKERLLLREKLGREPNYRELGKALGIGVSATYERLKKIKRIEELERHG